MKAPVFVGQDLRSLRDTGTEYPPPFRNPAPDQEGVVRFICRAKPQESTAYLLKLDKLRLDLPPLTASGWREFEDLAADEAAGGLSAWQPKQGRFEWSGWGAVAIRSQPGGKAVFRALVPAGQPPASEVALKVSLGLGQGTWLARVLHSEGLASSATELVPGKDAEEVVEWRVPVAGLHLPGAVLFEFTCAAAGKKDERTQESPNAELTLDAWTVR